MSETNHSRAHHLYNICTSLDATLAALIYACSKHLWIFTANKTDVKINYLLTN